MPIEIMRSMMDLALQAPVDVAHRMTRWATLALGGTGLVGWLTTSNVTWLLATLASVIPCGYGVYLGIRHRKWQAAYDRWELGVKAEERKAEARRKIRETGETAIPQGLEPGHVEDIDDMGSGSHPRFK